MALTHTDRGDTTADDTGALTTVTSAAFTPTNGTLLTASGYSIQEDGGDVEAFTITSTGFTTTTWTERTAGGINDGGTYSIRSGIWTATVTSSASGTVTLTRSSGYGGGYSLLLQVDEWAGHNGHGLAASANDSRAAGTTLTIPFGGTPAASSGAVGVVGDNNGGSTGLVQPTGWTETSDVALPNTGNTAGAAWILTGAQASPQWTAMQSNTFGKCGSVLEILDASAAAGKAPPFQTRRPNALISRRR
jgi:hypothetical protein